MDKNDKLSREEICGLHVVFNSTIYDEYYRILNGSTQVNANEINNIPIPSRQEIRQFGIKVLAKKDFSVKACDEILMGG